LLAPCVGLEVVAAVVYVDDPGDGGSVPGSGRTIKKGWTDMTDDTATLTSDDLETI